MLYRVVSHWLTSAVLTAGIAVPAFALDTVHRTDGSKPAGTVSSVTPAEVVVTQKIGNKETKIPANEVTRIDWDGEPAKLTLAKGTEAGTAYLDAKAELEEFLKGDLKPNVKTDVEFYLARIAYRQALADPAVQKDALKKLADFANLRKTSYRHYESLSLLGELALIAGDTAAADKAFGDLEKAPWPETQLAARLGSARVLLLKKDAAGAKKIFDAVASTDAKTPAETSKQLEGMLGQAECLMLDMKHAEALKVLEQVIDKSAPSDTRLQAMAYIRQGDCLKATNANPKQSAIAYLHVDLLADLAAHKDLHAEALYNLFGLWTSLGQPDRAERVEARLKEEYPNSDWTKKIGG